MGNNPKRKAKRVLVRHVSVYKRMDHEKAEEERMRREQQRKADRMMKKSEKRLRRQKKPRGKNKEYLQSKK